MAFAATALTAEPRSFSIGPLKMEIQTFSAAALDVAGTVTSTRLNRIDHCIVVGLTLTAQPSISNKTVTLAFVDPNATVAGTVLLLGR